MTTVTSYMATFTTTTAGGGLVGVVMNADGGTLPSIVNLSLLNLTS